MPAVRVRRFVLRRHSLLTARTRSSVYQDVPLYALDEFKKQAPEDNRTEQILADEHQLMLSRLNFELSERQRFVLHPVFLYALPQPSTSG